MRTPWEIPALALAAVVAACSGAAPASLCPEPKAYTADEDSRAASELLTLPKGSVLAEMILDYGRERAELRACRRVLRG